jgi:carbamoyl-phosphate synthase large subunit
MGVHTGDSITIAPAQTLTDKEYQIMRDASLAIIREIGVDTGGSNVQFAINPKDGRVVIIEMNPRVSRSSALASKATGFPIAKIAAKLAVGYTLDEIPNDITEKTPACFEPTIDYCVTKIPRFAFEKFSGSKDSLGTQMKSVGEAMAMGRTFAESLQKALRSLEIGRAGFGADGKGAIDPERLKERLITPNSMRIFAVHHALLQGMPCAEIAQLTAIDPWFLEQMKGIVELEQALTGRKLPELSKDELRDAKANGFSDLQLAWMLDCSEEAVRARRHELSVLRQRQDKTSAQGVKKQTVGDCMNKATRNGTDARKSFEAIAGNCERQWQCPANAALAQRQKFFNIEIARRGTV